MSRCYEHDRTQESTSFLQKLKQGGLRLTDQRRAIVNAITQFRSPFSAEDLLAHTKKERIDLVTIYRSLHAFRRLGILSTVDFSDGIVRYEYVCEQGPHHHHIVCIQCRVTEPITSCTVSSLEDLVRKRGYSEVFHRLEFFGLCKRCQTSAQA